MPWSSKVLLVVLCDVAAFTARAAVEPPVVAPSPIARVDAVYPPGAPPATLDVILAVEVGVDGRVGAVTVAQSGGASFDEAAVAAAKQWTFTPATRAGLPIASRIRLSFHFAQAATAPAPPAAAAAPPAASAPASAAPAPAAGAGGATASDEAQERAAASGQPVEVTVTGKRPPPSRGAADFNVTVGALGLVPRKNASDILTLAPGILLTNDGGCAHAEQVFLRGFDAREGQDIELTAGGVPINEAGNLHGNGYADTHFILPELVSSLRVLEGPFDPRQGNFAVAGSADYQLGLPTRGLTGSFSAGSFGTYRGLALWGPPGQTDGTFAGVEVYQSDGWGQNRDCRRATAMAQYEKRAGASLFHVGASAYIATSHSAGIVREDDYDAGRTCFYCTYDPNQGADVSRYSVWADHESHLGRFVLQDQIFGVARPMRLRENFTGFLLDVQEPQQSPHGQRGDLIDLSTMAFTVGARGSLRATIGHILGLAQEVEAGYFARGDFTSGSQTRIEAATGHPYHVESDLDSSLGDLGLYLDASLRPWKYLTLRGGVRADVFTYDVLDKCAQQSVSHPSRTDPPGDASCLSQQEFGLHREPFQRSTTSGIAFLPRVTVQLGPLAGVLATASYGQGARSVEPFDVSQDARAPFARSQSVDAGLAFARRLPAVDLSARGSFFQTRLDRELIFNANVGRNVASGATTRNGAVFAARATGRFYDANANVTWVHGTFDESGLLIAYIPELVLRFDGALHGDLPLRRLRPAGRPFRASLAGGLTYVSPRPLPQGERSNPIFTIDANASLGWWFLDVGVSIQNLLDTQYRLGEYSYLSDFHSQSLPTLVPARMFSAGPPRTVLFTVSITYGGA